jgi:hypothetical protein
MAEALGDGLLLEAIAADIAGDGDGDKFQSGRQDLNLRPGRSRSDRPESVRYKSSERRRTLFAVVRYN